MAQRSTSMNITQSKVDELEVVKCNLIISICNFPLPMFGGLSDSVPPGMQVRDSRRETQFKRLHEEVRSGVAFRHFGDAIYCEIYTSIGTYVGSDVIIMLI
jgi:hypothetical protein